LYNKVIDIIDTTIQIHDIQFSITMGHHNQTKDLYDNTVKTNFLIRLDHCANFNFLYYKQIINC